VLRGAEKTLSEVKPNIYIEVGESTCRKVSEILHENSYTLFEIDKSSFNLKQIETCMCNTLAVHECKINSPH
jgi:hypothetical protein